MARRRTGGIGASQSMQNTGSARRFTGGVDVALAFFFNALLYEVH
jgi:hypothetical protein